MSECVCVYIHVYIHVYIYVCMCMCIYVCVCFSGDRLVKQQCRVLEVGLLFVIRVLGHF